MKFAIATAAALLLAIFVYAGAGGQTPPRSLLDSRKGYDSACYRRSHLVCGLSQKCP